MSADISPLYGDPLEPAAPKLEREVSSFWRRFAAFSLDAAIVGVAAFLLTIPFFNSLSKLGPYGPLVGTILALPYYAILNSKLGGGQTLGKRVLDIQVIDATGQTISFPVSILRYGMLFVPYFLSDVALPTTRTPWLVSLCIQVLGVVSAATFYLLILNRNTRQGIHDLAAGTFVTQADLLAPPSTKPLWKPHWLIFGLLVVAFYAGGWIVGKKITAWGPFPQMMEDVTLLEKMQGVQSANVLDQTSYTAGRDNSKHSLVITVNWAGDSADRTAFADQVAKAILSNDAGAQNYDTLRVAIVRGYNIGIARSSITYSFEHSPSQWISRWSGEHTPASTTP